jgi:multiple sugar transport system substrate-binding protein
MDAYNVKLVDDDGKLLVDDPKVRQASSAALTGITPILTEGGHASSSTSWKDPDNNVAFHNKTTVLTHNATISIAAKWLDDIEQPNADAGTARPRQEELRTADPHGGLPDNADGSTMVYRTAVKVGAIFTECEEQGEGEGVNQLPPRRRQPDAVRRGALGRLVPVTKVGQERPFWQADRHASRLRAVQGRHRRRSSSPRTTSSRCSTTRTSGPRPRTAS